MSFLRHIGKDVSKFQFDVLVHSAVNLGRADTNGEPLYCECSRHSKTFRTKVKIASDGDVVWSEWLSFRVTLYKNAKAKKFLTKNYVFHVTSGDSSKRKVSYSRKIDLAQYASADGSETPKIMTLYHGSSGTKSKFRKDKSARLKVTFKSTWIQDYRQGHHLGDDDDSCSLQSYSTISSFSRDSTEKSVSMDSEDSVSIEDSSNIELRSSSDHFKTGKLKTASPGSSVQSFSTPLDPVQEQYSEDPPKTSLESTEDFTEEKSSHRDGQKRVSEKNGESDLQYDFSTHVILEESSTDDVHLSDNHLSVGSPSQPQKPTEIQVDHSQSQSQPQPPPSDNSKHTRRLNAVTKNLSNDVNGTDIPEKKERDGLNSANCLSSDTLKLLIDETIKNQYSIGDSGARYWSGIPISACILFRCLAHMNAFDVANKDSLVEILTSVEDVIHKHSRDNREQSFWLTNLLLFQHLVTRYKQQLGSTLGDSTEDQKECLLWFGEQLGILVNRVLDYVLTNGYNKLSTISFPSLLDQSEDGDIGSPTSELITMILTETWIILEEAHTFPTIRDQIVARLFEYVNCRLFNCVVENANMCTMMSGMKLKLAASYMRQWCKENTGQSTRKMCMECLAEILEVCTILMIDKRHLDIQFLKNTTLTLNPTQISHVLKLYNEADLNEDKSSRSLLGDVATWKKHFMGKQSQRGAGDGTSRHDGGVGLYVKLQLDTPEKNLATTSLTLGKFPLASVTVPEGLRGLEFLSEDDSLIL